MALKLFLKKIEKQINERRQFLSSFICFELISSCLFIIIEKQMRRSDIFLNDYTCHLYRASSACLNPASAEQLLRSAQPRPTNEAGWAWAGLGWVLTKRGF